MAQYIVVAGQELNGPWVKNVGKLSGLIVSYKALLKCGFYHKSTNKKNECNKALFYVSPLILNPFDLKKIRMIGFGKKEVRLLRPRLYWHKSILVRFYSRNCCRKVPLNCLVLQASSKRLSF